MVNRQGVHLDAPKSRIGHRNGKAFCDEQDATNLIEKFSSEVLNGEIRETKSIGADGPMRGRLTEEADKPLPSMLLYGGYGYEN
ncbi:hypothetical protein [Rhizobium sp.]|uniref:hypothetical protein n=1 Tax=Rhizobium sp. TaxID=391 RepID=UPI0028AD1B73